MNTNAIGIHRACFDAKPGSTVPIAATPTAVSAKAAASATHPACARARSASLSSNGLSMVALGRLRDPDSQRGPGS
jgi:hypothetical protein